MLEAGQTFGSYVLVEPLGRGGMGEVWVARHALLDRPAALKVIRNADLADTATGGVLGARFAREARAAAGLSSPHTVRIFDFGTTADDAFYYAMELLDGIDLRAMVERFGPLPPERVVRFLLLACESLAEAHRAGLVHRDVKPANLFASRAGVRVDFLKVLDFGLVKSLEGAREDTQLTSAGATAGSPAFMAPEVAMGEAIDARTDLYGLGCVAFWLLTGQLLFDERTAVRTLMAHVGTAPRAPSAALGAPLPAGLDEVVLACLAKRPDDRPASAEDLARRLRDVALASPWTDARAEAWWREHLPDPRAVPELPTELPALTSARAPTPAVVPPLQARAAAAAPTAAAPAGADLAASRVPRAPKAPFEARRDAAVGQLQEAFGQGDLSLSEYDQRVDLAERARDERELQVLVTDLPHLPAVVDAPRAPVPAVVPAAQAGLAVPPPKRKRFIAIFSGKDARSKWRVPEHVRAVAVFGGIELDLRRAELTTAVTTFHCTAVFGGINLTVPPGMRVEVDGVGVFGAFDHVGSDADVADEGPIVRVTGAAVFGGVSVVEKGVDEKWQLPWKRHRGRDRHRTRSR
ncbi:MAG: protein kinase [Myxococcales bacterium]|nr:protein kinase [Myxococcales bacterium]